MYNISKCLDFLSMICNAVFAFVHLNCLSLDALFFCLDIPTLQINTEVIKYIREVSVILQEKKKLFNSSKQFLFYEMWLF